MLDHFKQLRAIAGFANDGVTGNVEHQSAHAGSDQRVVIHQK
jgi:outer membrane PBP1 activator LpoA protein